MQFNFVEPASARQTLRWVIIGGYRRVVNGKTPLSGKKRRIALFCFLGEFVDELFDVLAIILEGGAAGVGDGE